MKIFKQYYIPYIGAFVDSLYTALPVLSIVNFLSILTVLYATTKEYIAAYTPWLTFRVFVLLLGGLTVVTMITFYKFVLPSVWTFRQQQMFKYESELLREVKALRKEIQELKEVGNER